MRADENLADLLLLALSQSLRARRTDVADHILSAIERMTNDDPGLDDLAAAYRMIADRN